MKTTEKEKAVLKGILNSEYQDGEDPIDREVFTFSVNPPEGCDRTSMGGIIASLEKKGLIFVGEDEGDDTIAITAEGMKNYKEAN